MSVLLKIDILNKKLMKKDKTLPGVMSRKCSTMTQVAGYADEAADGRPAPRRMALCMLHALIYAYARARMDARSDIRVRTSLVPRP